MAIGVAFPYAALERMAGEAWACDVFPVRYDRAAAADAWAAMRRYLGRRPARDGIGAALGVLSRALYRWKHPAFASEQEVRMVFSALDDGATIVGDGIAISPVRYQATPHGICDYRELRVPTACIAEVVLGPRYPGDAREVERFLRAGGYRRVPVARSGAPYQ